MSTSVGTEAEDKAALYLEKLGMSIVARNWRSKWSEIDIIACDEQDTIHFVEVKYRRSAVYGSGFDYITPDKINRLRRAATAWMMIQHLEHAYQIDVISVMGKLDDPTIEYEPNAVED
jgi:uncharacterized protein (TIGR00252 family)